MEVRGGIKRGMGKVGRGRGERVGQKARWRGGRSVGAGGGKICGGPGGEGNEASGSNSSLCLLSTYCVL